MKTLYTAVATATDKGRNGHTRTDDGKLDLDLSMPEAMGGPGGEGTNPEQLFAALSQADAEALVAKAHERCPYSNATRGNIDVVLEVSGR